MKLLPETVQEIVFMFQLQDEKQIEGLFEPRLLPPIRDSLGRSTSFLWCSATRARRTTLLLPVNICNSIAPTRDTGTK